MGSPMRVTSSDYDELSEYDAYSVESGRSLDTLEDLMERFTLDCRPDYTLKLRHRLGPLVLGADVAHHAATNKKSGALLVKPSSEDAWWRRLRVDGGGEVSLRSRKLHWWVLAVNLEGHAHPRTRDTNLSFRVATKWDYSRGQIRNKKRLGLGRRAEARVHWSVDYHLPELAGTVAARRDHMSSQVQADMGYAHAAIPKVELVLWPAGERPRLRDDDEVQQQQQPAGGAGRPSGSGRGAAPAPEARPAVAPAARAAGGSVTGPAGMLGGWASDARNGWEDLQRRARRALQAFRE